MRRLALIFLLALSCRVLCAQFSLSGSDPGYVRWSKMDSPTFRIIYPEGEDSLAIVYASWLEKAKSAVSLSSGMEIGEYQRGRLAVVLHGFNPVANASVTWAPKRMDIFTALDPYAPTPITWEKLLAIHEGRHASQMQAGEGGRFKVLGYLVGELFAGAVSGLYPGPTLLEGDAVVAETALTSSGRGRQASFLSYMAPALDCGDFRDYWRWSLGSFKRYTPDHYRAGYTLVSGMRVFFDDPLFTDEYFSRVRKGGFFVLKKTVKAASGMNINGSFKAILGEYGRIWSEEAAGMGSFMPSEQVSRSPWRHVSYSGSVIDNHGGIWSKKGGLYVEGSLVRTESSGAETRARSFASYTSPLAYDSAGDRIWWSETVSGRRWSLGGSSRIRYVDAGAPSKIHDLTKEGRFFNPTPSPNGRLVCSTEYPPSGGSRLVVMNVSDGSVERVVEAPDSLQFTESAWVGNSLFVAGLSDKGMGIYEILPAGLKKVLPPQPVELSNLKTAPSAIGQGLTFVCDRNGRNEMYLLETGSCSLAQVTSTRYGISSPVFNSAADTLFYSSLAPSDKPENYRQGWVIYSTPTKDLPMTPVRFDDIHVYPVADALSAQEKALAGDRWDNLMEYSETTVSAPSRYSKLMPTLHSWAPIYFNYDNVETFSGDEYYRTASLGATAMFQNLVGDGYGLIGYGAHEDPDLKGSWRHSGHLRYIYNGFYPAFELSADIGDRAAFDLTRVQQVGKEDGSYTIFTDRVRTSRPYTEGSLKVYIPFNFSSGGLSRGLVPQVRYRFSNDRLNDKISFRVNNNNNGGVPEEVSHINENHLSYLSTIDISLRGYIVRAKAPSQVYPRLGFGAEAGFRTWPGHSASYGDMAYLYSYGYLPGLTQDQGIRLTATFGAKVGGGRYSYPESSVSFIPRGFSDSNVRSILNSCSPLRYKLTFDYGIRLLSVDWSGLSPLTYIKGFTITPFADYSFQKFDNPEPYRINPGDVVSERLLSVGADLTINLGNFFWLPYDSQLGIRYARNFWGAIERFSTKGLSHDHFEAIFSVSL